MKKEHVILIKSDPSAKPSDQQHVVRPSKRSKHLARRVGSGIRLYDMGYWLVGSDYETIPYYDPLRDIEITTSPIFPVATAAQFEDRDDLIFAVPMADWETKFKLVDSAYAAVTEPFISWNGTQYDLADDPPEWSDGIFTPPGSYSSGFNAELGDGPIPTGGGLHAYDWGYKSYDASYKVTTERDYSADAVAFTPGRKMDIFIFPSFNHIGGAWTLFTYNENFGAFRVLRSREWALDPGYEYYQINLTPGWNTGGYGSSLSEYEDVFDNINYIKEYYASVRAAYHPNHPSSTPPFWTPTNFMTFPNSVSFPPPPSLPVDVPGTNETIQVTFSAPIQDVAAGISLDITVPGVLKSVIHKGGRYYYLWQS